MNGILFLVVMLLAIFAGALIKQGWKSNAWRRQARKQPAEEFARPVSNPEIRESAVRWQDSTLTAAARAGRLQHRLQNLPEPSQGLDADGETSA